MRHWLRPKAFWAGAIALAVAALAIVVGTGAAAGTTSAGAKPAVPPGTAYSRITGRPILGSSPAGISNSAAAPTPTPPRKQQIRVLKRVLHGMQKNYAKYANETPGPQDIMDYGIGSLWLKGIDGAGTTVAVIEGWKDSHIAATGGGLRQAVRPAQPEDPHDLPGRPAPEEVSGGDGQARQLWLLQRVAGRADARRHISSPRRPVRQDRHLGHAGRHARSTPMPPSRWRHRR